MKTIILILLSAVVLSAAPPAASDTEKEVLAAMEAYKQAYLHGDAAAIAKLLSSKLSYIESDGSVRNKAQTVKAVAASPHPVKIEFLPDTTVRIHGTVAFVVGNTDFWDSRTVKHMNVLHVWEKTAQGWQMVARQATLISIQTRRI